MGMTSSDRRVLLVTGASRGIGSAVARQAARQGWDVALNCRAETAAAEQVAVMLFLLLAIAFILLKYLEVGFVAALTWWWVLAPLGLAMAWWTWSDKSGRSKRIAMEKMEAKRQDRIRKHKEALMSGFKPRR